MSRRVTYRRPWVASLLGGLLAYFGYAIASVGTLRMFDLAPFDGPAAVAIGLLLSVVSGLIVAVMGLVFIVGLILCGLAVVAGRIMLAVLARTGWSGRRAFALGGAVTGLPFGLVGAATFGTSAGTAGVVVSLLSAPAIGAGCALAMRRVAGVQDGADVRRIAETF